MSSINKDQRITSWQTKTKHNFIQTSVTSSFLSSFFPSQLELFCSTADVSCINKEAIYLSLISFFLATRICLYFCFTKLWAGCRTRFQCEVWANMFAAFSPAIAHLSSFWCFGNLQNHPFSLKIYASLLIANSESLLNIKSRRHPT